MTESDAAVAGGVKRARDEDGAGTASAPAPPPQQRRFVLERGSEPALGLLAALGIGHDTALEGLAERASKRLVEAIPSMPPGRLRKLLLSSFEHIDSARLQAVAVAALTHAPELPQSLVETLVGPKRDLLGTLPLRVRQRIWETEEPPTLFLEATHGLIITLQEEGAAQLARVALREAAEVAPRQRRAESRALQELAALVGSAPLYNALTRLTSEIHAATGDASMAGLRRDLTMALHESQSGEGAHPVSRWDPLHTFVCCVDAALRERHLEHRAGRILLTHVVAAGLPTMEGEGEGSSGGADGSESAGMVVGSLAPALYERLAAAPPHAVLLEMAMTISTPPFVQLLTQATLARLAACVESASLPAADAELRTLIPLLTLAHRAAAFARSGQLPATERWRGLITLMMHKALPVAAELLAGDRIAEEHARLDEGPSRRHPRTNATAAATTAAAATSITPSGGGGGGGGGTSILELPEGLGGSAPPALGHQKSHQKSLGRRGAPPLPGALTIMLHKGHGRGIILEYALHRVEAADAERVEQLLPLIASSVGAELRHHEDFAGGLASALMAEPTRRLTPRIARAAVSACLLPLSRLLPHAHSQLLRLLQSQWRVLTRVPAVDVADQAAASMDGVLRRASSVDAAADDGEVLLNLVQMAAREAREHGAVEETEEAKAAMQRAYAKLERSVPALFAAKG